MKVAVIIVDNREDHGRYEDPKPFFGMAPAALVDGFAQLPEVEIHVISCLQRPVRSPEKLASNIFYHSLVVPKLGWLRAGYLGCIAAVRRKLREIKPDIVHGQGTERYCALCAAFSGYPNVVTIHGNMRAVARALRARLLSFNWITARLEALTLPRTQGVLCNSVYTELETLNLAKKTWRVPNALQPIFLEEPSLIPRAKPPILITAATFSPYKQQAEILDCLQRLRDRGFDFKMLFAGKSDSPYGTKVLERLTQPQTACFAQYIGLKSAEELKAVLDSASAMIHFPVEEAFGLSAAEGLARNLKLFCARTGGLVDIANEVEGVELFDAKDWQGLERSIGAWLIAGAPTPVSSAEVMQRRYHPLSVARRTVEIYREILAT